MARPRPISPVCLDVTVPADWPTPPPREHAHEPVTLCPVPPFCAECVAQRTESAHAHQTGAGALFRLPNSTAVPNGHAAGKNQSEQRAEEAMPSGPDTRSVLRIPPKRDPRLFPAGVRSEGHRASGTDARKSGKTAEVGPAVVLSRSRGGEPDATVVIEANGVPTEALIPAEVDGLGKGHESRTFRA